jgi:RNA polymerase-binding transcription factor DksA
MERGSPALVPTASGPLTKAELDLLRAMLLEQRAFRIDQLSQLQRARPGDPLSDPDPEIERSLSAGSLAALRDVERALWRMEEGTYGRCVDCGSTLPLERLEILPQTARCLRCQRPPGA